MTSCVWQPDGLRGSHPAEGYLKEKQNMFVKWKRFAPQRGLINGSVFLLGLQLIEPWFLECEGSRERALQASFQVLAPFQASFRLPVSPPPLPPASSSSSCWPTRRPCGKSPDIQEGSPERGKTLPLLGVFGLGLHDFRPAFPSPGASLEEGFHLLLRGLGHRIRWDKHERTQLECVYGRECLSFEG